MNTEPTIVMVPHIDSPIDNCALELLNERQDRYYGRKDTYLAQEQLDGVCGSYRAIDSERKDVFLKAFDSPRLCEKTKRESYQRETRASKDLSQISVTLEIKDTGREHLFIVQDFVEGMTLDELLDLAGPLREDHAKKVLTPIARTLGEAHKKGYTHRDLKPQNILYRSEDVELERPIILDWGFSFHETEKYNISHCVGTPYYAALEQFTSSGIADERSDIYALGIILHKLLSGTVPYGEKDSLRQIADKKASAHNPKLSNPNADNKLSLLTIKMTQPDKNERHQNIDELLEDLKRPRLEAAK